MLWWGSQAMLETINPMTYRKVLGMGTTLQDLWGAWTNRWRMDRKDTWNDNETTNPRMFWCKWLGRKNRWRKWKNEWTEWTHEWLMDKRLVERRMNEWNIEGINKRRDERNEKMNKLNKWMIEWMHEWMNEWMDGWMDEWTNEWMKWLEWNCMHACRKQGRGREGGKEGGREADGMNEWTNGMERSTIEWKTIEPCRYFFPWNLVMPCKEHGQATWPVLKLHQKSHPKRDHAT